MDTAVILAGGRGIRLLPEASELPKPMVRVRNKPILEYIVSLLVGIGFRKAYMVVGYRKEVIQDYFKDGRDFGLSITYIENRYIDDKKKSGLVDAVMLTEGLIEGTFMTILGDEIYLRTKHKEMVDAFGSEHNCEAMIGVYQTNDLEEVKKNYAVLVDENRGVRDLEEKPRKPWNNLVGCGSYLFTLRIFEYLRRTPLSLRTGRREIADTLKIMVEEKKIVKVFPLGGCYININQPEDLQIAEEYLTIEGGK
ncbi:MAG: nucleotidyltransferase family protein [bacterium]|nr:nucleotidyltransferase family protein [bacterium]